MSRKQLKTSSRIFLLLTLLVIATTLALLFLMLLDNDLNMKEMQQTAVIFDTRATKVENVVKQGNAYTHRKKLIKDLRYDDKPTERPVASVNKEQRIECIPANDRLHPMCEEEFQRLKAHWTDRCFKEYHGVDGTNCSILWYLQKIEPFCQRNVNAEIKYNPPKAKIRTDIEGLMAILSHADLWWVRNRIKTAWAHWVEAANEIKKDEKYANRDEKKILFYPGAIAEQRWMLKQAGRGSFLGEIVQWTDTITSSYILGHDILVRLERNDVTRVLQIDFKGCVAKISKEFPDYDLIFTDIYGHTFSRVYLLGATTSRHRCKVRLLDSFGTEAEYNYEKYDKKPADNSWGTQNLLLPQYYTYFPHSPDNTFLGFAIGNGQFTATVPKKNQAVIYGKRAHYLEGKKKLLDVIKDYFEIHATMAGNENIPSYVKNHGVLSYSNLTKLLSESKVFIGLGFPFEGPGPLEAISYGAVFLNPKFSPPRGKHNDNFFGGKPNRRNITSQNQYLEDFVGEPYVHTIDMDDIIVLRETLKKIKAYKQFEGYTPREFTTLGMLERLGALIQHQDLCDINAPRWPPLRSLYKFLAAPGRSCKDECHKRGLICEQSFFTDINNWDTFKRFGIRCKTKKMIFDVNAPFYLPSNGTCYLQGHLMYLSCVAKGPSLRRLCPCRTYANGQTALCEGC